MFFQEAGEFVDTVFTKHPVVTDLAQTENDFQEVRVGGVTLLLGPVIQEHSFRFRSEKSVSVCRLIMNTPQKRTRTCHISLARGDEI